MAEAEKKEEAEKGGVEGAAAEASAAKPSRMKTLLPYVGGGVLSIGLGVFAGVVKGKKHDEPAKEEKKDDKQEPAELSKYPCTANIELPELIFNCADAGQSVAGRVNIILEVRTTDKLGKAGEKKSPFQEKVEEKGGRYLAPMKDALITLFTNKTSTELRTARGKELAKLEVLDLMNKILAAGENMTEEEKKKEEPLEGVVTSVYFSNFLVQ